MAKKKNQVIVSTKSDLKERDKAIKTVLGTIEKDFGVGAIMRLSDNTNLNIERIKTGSLGLDEALGGGIPRGRIIEIYGAESSGKTTIALHIIAEAQKNGGIVAYIDAEHALDPVYAKALGVDIDEVLISQPDFGEQALDIADLLARSGAVDVIVVDSVAALVPQAEIEGLMTEQQMGLQARLMAKGLRKLTGNLKKTDTAIIFINQLREKIGGMPSYNGPQTTTTGGRALKFFASVRIEVRRVGTIKAGDDIIGNETVVKVTKNKVAPPFKEASFEIMYGKGISKIGEYMSIAEDINLISKSGSWYKYGDVRLQGKEKLRDRFEEDEELFADLKSKIDKMIEEKEITIGKKSKKNDIKQEKDADLEVADTEMTNEDGEVIETEVEFEE